MAARRTPPRRSRRPPGPPAPCVPACEADLPSTKAAGRATLVHRLRPGRDVTRRKQLLLALRLFASVGMLAYLLTRFTRFHLGSLLPRWHTSTLAWLVVGLVLTLVGIVLATFRWQRVIIGLDLRDRLSTLLSHYLAGLFVGNFLPSTIGGDVLRITRLSADTGDPPASFASVVLERLSGWIVLPLLTLVG